MAIFGNKDKQGNFTINFMSVENTPIYEYPNTAISVTLLEDKVEFKQRLGKKIIYLKYSQIIKIGTISEEKIIEKDKSVIKSAIVGSLLFGDLGAIVGAIDGTGKKKISKGEKNYFIFNYISNNGEEKLLPVEIVGATMGLAKFIDNLEKLCPNLKIEKNNNVESGEYL